MTGNNREIEIVLGSQSDMDQIQGGLEELGKRGVRFRVHIISCHRNPEDLRLYARDRVTEDMIVIAAAPTQAALPGVLQSWLRYFGKELVWVIGVALKGKTPRANTAATLAIDELPDNPVLLQNGTAYFGPEGFAAACRDAATKEFAMKVIPDKPARLDFIMSS